ncbi:aminoglycoside phosphotransferase family protein [Lacibacterium aquatile]|uniref:Aminoglycoside phosphotransferase family protein n=1 Tax=Lacibacterium aquatile TaxID=1168082 RepID=A0ABW5DP94_9PROT
MGRSADLREINREGTSVDVLILEGGHVVRVARTDAAADALARETALLTRIAPHLPVRVPDVIDSAPGLALQVYIPGEPLTRRRLANLPPARREAVLADTHNFLTAMGGLALDVPAAPAPHAPSDFADLRSRAELTLFPRLSRSLAEEMRGFLDEQAAEPLDSARPGLIHGDLHPSHLLIDTENQTLTGIIDFGLAGRADTAIDLAGLWYNWGDGAIAHLTDDLAKRARACRYARTYEIQWALTALEEDRPDWLLYAMGAAKAIGADVW